MGRYMCTSILRLHFQLLLLLVGCITVVSANWHLEIYVEEGERENTEVVHVGDGWYYHFNRGDAENAYYRCVLYNTLRCPGRAIYHANLGFRHSQPHNGHDADVLHSQELHLKRNILQRCRTLEYIPFSRIVREEQRRFPARVAARVTLASMRTSMRNARLANYPPIPGSLRALTDMLRDPQTRILTMTDDGRDNVYLGSVNDENNDHHMILSSTRLVGLLSRLELLFCDGTFDIVPSINTLRNRRAQIYCIATSWRHHTIPVAWVIMESRTEVAYVAVLTLLRNLLPRQPNFARVITDEEAAQTNAWNTVFQPDTLQSCLWHIARAFVTEISVLRLGGWFHNADLPQFRVIVRMACALPLLPAALLRRGWVIIRREARHQGGNFLFNLMLPFFEYLWTFWVNNRRRRMQMSVYRSQHRTNNVCESLNSKMLRMFGRHPNIFHFLNCIVELEQSAYTDVITLLRGENPSRARTTRAIVNDQIINNLYEELEHPPMGIDDAVRRFLLEASNRVEGIMNQHIP